MIINCMGETINMKQLLQYNRETAPRIEDVPRPQMKAKGLLVDTRCSLVSVGTERQMIQLSQMSLVGKARQRPDLVKQVISRVKTEGLSQTYNKVMGRLKTPTSLGYSAAGVVSGVHDALDRFAVGDRVACAGFGYASHAESIFVPANLAVKIPDGVTDEEASFVTLGAIALQGVRVAEPKLGETVAVIGLGLLGQLTCMLLEASGCRVIGLDIDPAKLELARRSGAPLTFIADSEAVNGVLNATSGHGADAVIITAAADSSQPVEMAGEICREKGTVSVVGAVRIDVPRKPYYDKELSLKLSRSYGPGRYDYNYEEAGMDYPYGYVRWTENRNMEAFLQLVAQGKLDVKSLITHRFDISEAEKAYELISGKTTEQFMGVILNYPDQQMSRKTQPDEKTAAPAVSTPRTHIGFVGAGNFASGVLLPAIASLGDLVPVAITSGSGVSAVTAAERFGFGRVVASTQEILDSDDIGAVFIATRHNQHAGLTIESLRRGKAVFVEKPLCLNREELESIEREQAKSGAPLMVGFNRRFAPMIINIKKQLDEKRLPLSMHYRINAGFIPPGTWVQDPESGGGRIVGEVCHFVDLLMFLAGSRPVKIYAEALSSGGRYRSDDNLQVTLRFENGSVGSINYVACGNPLMPKEYLEIFGGGLAVTLNDFKVLTVADDKGLKISKSRAQDKGHRTMLKEWSLALTDNRPSPIPFEQIVDSTQATFAILDSLSGGGIQWMTV